MFLRGGFDPKALRPIVPKDKNATDMLVELAAGNPDKVSVMQYIGELVATGIVTLVTIESDEIEAHFSSGEIYLLSETTVLRLA